MADHQPLISVIIPTHNRKDSLKRALDSLCGQVLAPQLFEVIVVADGCSDNTGKFIAEYNAPFQLRIVEQESKGAAGARNAGAAIARGELLVFMDDDIEPSPEFLEAHAIAHTSTTPQVVIGYLPPIVQNKKGFFFPQLKNWWESMFYEMSHRGHRFTYRNLLTGNMSLPTALFRSVGGFDNTFLCQEDYELGFRLIEAGTIFRYEPRAMGYHHEMTDMKRSFDRKYQEGISAIRFLRKKPELIRTIHLLQHFTKGYPRYYKWLLRLLYHFPLIPVVFEQYYLIKLKVYEGLRMRRSWRKTLDKLLAYHYMRGVAKASGNLDVLTKLVRAKPLFIEKPAAELDIDLDAGMEKAEKLLDQYRPATINIFIGSHPVGKAYTEIGTENFRGIHLKPLLSRHFAYPIVETLKIAHPIRLSEIGVRLKSSHIKN